MSRIQELHARQILDARGDPTLEVTVSTADGDFTAAVPCGFRAETADGTRRDGDEDKYGGRGVASAVERVNLELSDAVVGMDPTDQEGIDQAMADAEADDGGQPGRRPLGTNALLGVSMAVCRAGAAKKGIPLYKHINALAGNPTMLLPCPAFAMIQGGLGLGGMPFRELLVLPTGAETYAEALRMGAEVYAKLKVLVTEKYGAAATTVGDEGGLSPPGLSKASEGLALLQEAITAAGHSTDVVQLAVDAGASDLFRRTEGGGYNLDRFLRKSKRNTGTGDGVKTTEELSTLYKQLAAEFGVVSFEDPFYKGDWEGHIALVGALGEMVQIVGDDLLVSNAEKVEEAIQQDAVNGLCLELGRAPTVSVAIELNNQARNAGFGVVVAGRSGETSDTFLADFAVGLGTGQVKAGAPCRGERVAKYNQLLRIEEDLGDRANYAGEYWRDPWLLQPLARARSMNV
ncbi:hypothetical protein MMPV_002571 [Pyropia vietnamensis]